MYDQKQYINQLSNEVREYILGNNKISNPVDLNNQIEKSLHINVLYTFDNNFDGCLTVNQATKLPEIIINDNRNYNQQQWIVAHELGYLVLKYHWNPNKKLNDVTKPLDIYCLNK